MGWSHPDSSSRLWSCVQLTGSEPAALHSRGQPSLSGLAMGSSVLISWIGGTGFTSPGLASVSAAKVARGERNVMKRKEKSDGE